MKAPSPWPPPPAVEFDPDTIAIKRTCSIVCAVVALGQNGDAITVASGLTELQAEELVATLRGAAS